MFLFFSSISNWPAKSVPIRQGRRALPTYSYGLVVAAAIATNFLRRFDIAIQHCFPPSSLLPSHNKLANLLPWFLHPFTLPSSTLRLAVFLGAFW